MKTICLFAILSVSFLVSNAQQEEANNLNREDLLYKRSLESLLKIDSLKRQSLPLNEDRGEKVYNKRNNDYTIQLPLQRKKIGNNGKGADIYRLDPYKMPSIAPDSTFISRMPVAGSAVKKVAKEK